MPKPNELTLAFLENHPDSAADVLARLDAADAAALIQDTPARITAPVVERMPSWSAADTLTRTKPEAAAGLLAVMSPTRAAAVLRRLDGHLVNTFIALLPSAGANHLRTLLRYGEDEIGAWMDADVIVLPRTASVEDALRALREQRGRPQAGVLAVDDDGRLLGAADVVDLAASPLNSLLAGLVEDQGWPLGDHTPVLALRGDAEWQQVRLRPVVDRDRRPVGVLSNGAYQAALAQLQPNVRTPSLAELITHATATYTLCAAAAVQTVVAVAAGGGPASARR